MTPSQLTAFLERLISEELTISAMIWGPPGIGKSSIVSQAAKNKGYDFIDLRLSQLAPTDLRGLPVAIHPKSKTEIGISKWYPPEFLPKAGKGILFLDEINMAPPAMQGVAQQLILDRKVGNYRVPKDWLIWAAGNRKEDRASVFEMPTPLNNRFLHLDVEVNFSCFKSHALKNNLPEEIISFLGFRPALLHKVNFEDKAWPSPRSWEMASNLFKLNLPINTAIGDGAAEEFNSFLNVYKNLPNLAQIIKGNGEKINFPKQVSTQWATITGLTKRADKAEEVKEVFQWLFKKTTPEWIQVFAADIVANFKEKKQLTSLAKVVMGDPQMQKYLKSYQELIIK